MAEERNVESGEIKPRTGRPTGIKVLIAVNALTALFLLVMFPQYTGGRALLYLCAGILHTLLALGLYLRQGWASIVMVAYALFQVVGMVLWALIGLMTLAIEPLSEEKTQFLILAAVIVPFLIWTIFYLLRYLRNAPDTGQTGAESN
jgi:hypothetical protein